MSEKAIQDLYPDDTAHCYGCGRLNEHGLHVQSYWHGDHSIATFEPKSYHTAIPGFVYGGLIASLIDCHGTGTAALAAYDAAGREPGTEPHLRFVTGSLHVDYLKPTPMDTLTLRGEIKEIKGRKVVVAIDFFSGDTQTAKGEVVAIQIPEDWGK